MPINMTKKNKKDLNKPFFLKKEDFVKLLPVRELQTIILNLVQRLIIEDNIIITQESIVCNKCGMLDAIDIINGSCINLCSKDNAYPTTPIFTSPSGIKFFFNQQTHY